MTTNRPGTNITVDARLHRLMRIHAAMSGITIKDAAAAAFTEWMNHNATSRYHDIADATTVNGKPTRPARAPKASKAAA